MKDVKHKIKLYSPESKEGFNELEILELIEMIKDGEEDVKKPQFIQWLFSKSFITLSKLMTYMNQQA